MLSNLGGWHMLIILAILLLVFGASKLPGLAKSVGQSARILKNEMHTMKGDEPASPAAQADVVVMPSNPEAKQ